MLEQKRGRPMGKLLMDDGKIVQVLNDANQILGYGLALSDNLPANTDQVVRWIFFMDTLDERKTKLPPHVPIRIEPAANPPCQPTLAAWKTYVATVFTARSGKAAYVKANHVESPVASDGKITRPIKVPPAPLPEPTLLHEMDIGTGYVTPRNPLVAHGFVHTERLNDRQTLETWYLLGAFKKFTEATSFCEVIPNHNLFADLVQKKDWSGTCKVEVALHSWYDELPLDADF
jgi:hypothetical protein